MSSATHSYQQDSLSEDVEVVQDMTVPSRSSTLTSIGTKFVSEAAHTKDEDDAQSDSEATSSTTPNVSRAQTSVAPDVFNIQQLNRTGDYPPPEDASEAWAECARQVWEHESATVEKWKDEISNLLIFAGLFSAVLTAFNVQYYISLQPQASDPTAQLLMVMSMQLRILAAEGGHMTITDPIFSALPNSTTNAGGKAPVSAICINTLWFSALVFSLSAASIAMSVNQWLHHHTNRAATLSRQSVRIWHFRHRGLVEWGVPEIISILPVLLQISLTLFLIGLVELLWTLNTVVAIIVTILVVVLLTVSMCTAFIPALAPDCPYKSPQAWWWFLALRRLKALVYPLAKRLCSRCCQIYLRRHRGVRKRIARMIWDYLSRWCDLLGNWLKFTNWRDFDSYAVRSQVVKPDDRLAMLVEADATMMDDSFLNQVVRPCIASSDIKVALPAFYSILQRRAHWCDSSTSPATLTWYSTEQDTQPVIAMGHISIDLLSRLPPWHAHHVPVLQLLDNLLYAMPRSQLAVSVYSRLFGLLMRADLSQEVRSKIVFWIYCTCDNVQVSAGDLRTLISGIQIVQRDADAMACLRVLTCILRLSARLSQSDFGTVQHVVRDTIAVVLKDLSFTPAGEFLNPGQDRDRYSWLARNLLSACICVAKLDDEVFTCEMVDVLHVLASMCCDATLLDNVQQLYSLVVQPSPCTILRCSER